MIDWRETRRRWKKLGYPGAFSSSAYLLKAMKNASGVASSKGLTLKGTNRALQKSILYQAHRNLLEHFPKRAVATTTPGAAWEADVGDFGRKIRQAGGTGEERYFLIVVDTFSRKFYGRGMSNKSASSIEEALRDIVDEASKSKELSGRKGPEILETDAGKEFVNTKVKRLCAEKEIRLQTAQGTNKARMAERAIRSLKRVVMASVQSGRWPPKTSWNDKIKLACRGLNRRYNRGLGMSPQEGKRNYWRLLKKAWTSKNLTPFSEWIREENGLRRGEGVSGENIAPGDLVLLPKQKQRRMEVKDKEFEMHYYLMPYQVENVFHGRKPCLYRVKHLRNGKFGRRLYYARELKKITLPAGVSRDTLSDVRAVPGKGLEFRAIGKDWAPLPP